MSFWADVFGVIREVLPAFGRAESRPAKSNPERRESALKHARAEFAKQARHGDRKSLASYPIAWTPCSACGHLWVDHVPDDELTGHTTCSDCLKEGRDEEGLECRAPWPPRLE